MFTKESIFPLYVGKCKVRHTKKYTDDYGKPFPITCDYEFQAFYPKNDKTNEKVIAGHKGQTARINISDCTLLLKPLSKMSDEDIDRLVDDCDLLTTRKESREWTQEILCGDTLTNFETNVKITLWLISHGYAISDELFELKIAEEV